LLLRIEAYNRGVFGSLLNWLWMLIVFGYLIAGSVQTERPLATAAGWLVGIAAVLVWWALSPPPSPRGIAWSVLFALVGLALVAVYLAREGRLTEIAVWLPAIAAGLIGWLYLLVAVYDSRARAARGVLATVFLAVPITLWATVGDFTGVRT
jgi:hypothetical protein